MENTNMIPSCYIRLDVSHLIRMISRWKCLKGNDKILMRAFYLRCIGQAYKMNSLKEVKYFMESILIVALSKNIECTMDGKPLTSNERLQYLNGIIKGNNIIETNNTCDNNNNKNSETQSFSNDNSSYEENCNTSWLEWSNSIWDFAQKVAKNSEYGNIINACYNSDFAKQIKTRLLPYLPI